MTECGIDELARLDALRRYDVLDSEPEEAFDRITRLAKTVLQLPIVLVSLVDADRQWFKSKQGLEQSETPRNVSFCAHAILQDGPFIVPDAHLDPRFADNPLVTGEIGLRYYIGIPLVSRDGFNLGTLCGIDRKPRSLSAEQIAILEDLARLVIDELELRLIATSDSLTGAMSRRAFVESLGRDVARAKRHGRALTCVMVDADHFKAVNDTYGHAVGDQVLRAIVRVFKAELRGSDYVGRLGGEEFGVALTETHADDAVEVSERIRREIARLVVQTLKGPVGVTVSAGVAGLEAGVDSREVLLARADAALYAAKARGRNRTVAFDPLGMGELRVA